MARSIERRKNSTEDAGYRTLISARHPVDRLVSAFRDKIVRRFR